MKYYRKNHKLQHDVTCENMLSLIVHTRTQIDVMERDIKETKLKIRSQEYKGTGAVDKILARDSQRLCRLELQRFLKQLPQLQAYLKVLKQDYHKAFQALYEASKFNRIPIHPDRFKRIREALASIPNAKIDTFPDFLMYVKTVPHHLSSMFVKSPLYLIAVRDILTDAGYEIDRNVCELTDDPIRIKISLNPQRKTGTLSYRQDKQMTMMYGTLGPYHTSYPVMGTITIDTQALAEHLKNLPNTKKDKE